MGYRESVHAKALELTRLAIEITTEAGSGHPSSSASLAHVVTALMYDHMRYDPAAPDAPNADRLVLSEGHACPIVYAAGADLGLAVGRGERRPMTADDARALRAIGSEIDGHPNPVEGFPFFPAATGSLGQGLSIAAGLALAARLDGHQRSVFCLIGDGESREGQIWEAVDMIADFGLFEVLPIFNCNGYGQAGAVSRQQSPERIAAKLEGAGVGARIIDGHDPEEIRVALGEHAALVDDAAARPLAIVAVTTKGWGTPSYAGDGWHGKPVPDLDKAGAELDATASKVGAAWTPGDLERKAPAAITAAAPAPSQIPTFEEMLGRLEKTTVLEQRKLATRKAYGIALQALGHADPRIVVLDADVSNSTFAEGFLHDKALAKRFFECKIAEQNMVSAAAGFSAAGKIPFVSSFGKFLLRACDQIEMAVISGANLKLVGSHSGVSLAADGPSQMSLPDVAFFRSFGTARSHEGTPLMYVLQPSCAYAAYALTLAMAAHEGPCYLRTLRPDLPFLYDGTTEFTLGGHRVLREGGDLLIAASGYMVHESLKTCATLEKAGIQATLVDLYSLPFDEAAIAALADRCGGRVLTVEDNYGGGFGSAVCDALAATGKALTVRQAHVRRIPKSGRSPEVVLDYLSLTADHVAEQARALVGKAG